MAHIHSISIDSITVSAMCFKAILVQKDSHLQELARYIALSPVRAQMVHSAKEWQWSSYRATAGYDE